jgi:ATP-dependent protease HslVU (ClpYQ) ATPase subunit
MKYYLKKNKITEILVLDSNNSNINDNNINIQKLNEEINNKLIGGEYENNNINKDVDMEKCIINCPICGELNEINENSEMKCKFCESNLF